MDDIIEPGLNFDFSQLSLAQPIAIQGGAYFTKILNQGKPLYLQTPKISSKQGFVKSGKRIHFDIVFDNNDEAFIDWIENLETTCQNLIFKNSNAWFQNALDLNDIESAFNPVLKSYKAGKKYLARANVKTNSLTGSPVIKIYNENETTLSIDDVNGDTNIICILEVQGIKFTTRNFQIEIEAKQVMVLNTDKIFETCVIKKNNNNLTNQNNQVKNFLEEKPLEKETSNTIVSNNILSELSELSELTDLSTSTSELKKEEDALEAFEPFVEDSEQLDSSVPDKKDQDKDEYTSADAFIKKDPDQNKDKDQDQDQEQLNLFIDTTKTSEYEENERKETKNQNDVDSFELEEWDDFDNAQNLETITLKKPNQVYYDLYKKAREKAKLVKKEALLAYLEAKNIKKTYMLEIDSSDDSDLDDEDEDASDEEQEYEG